MSKVLEAIVQLRRDNEFNFEPIANSFIPANGEVVLIDTRRDGLRAKVGDGRTPLANLIWADARYRDAVVTGYYDESEDVFYETNTKEVALSAYTNRLYIDRWRNKVYYFNGLTYVLVDGAYSPASATTPGVVKLYSTTGQNTDGTMTQKAITDALDMKSKASVELQDELLVFSI